MAGHLARNQVHAGSIPAALTKWVGAPGRAVGLQSRRTAFESLPTRNAGGAAEWPATGPENLGRGAEPERFDPSAFLFTVESPSGKAPSCNLGTKRFDSALDLQSSHRCPNG